MKMAIPNTETSGGGTNKNTAGKGHSAIREAMPEVVLV